MLKVCGFPGVRESFRLAAKRRQSKAHGASRGSKGDTNKLQRSDRIGAVSLHRFVDPLQILGTAILYRQTHAFRQFVRVQFFDGVAHAGESLGRGLDPK